MGKSPLGIFDPRGTAEYVVDRYISSYRENPDRWGNNFEAGLRDYLADAEKQRAVIEKLTNYYSNLQRHIGILVALFKAAKRVARESVVIAPR